MSAIPSAIKGVGIDLVEIARVQKAIERHGELFLQRVFTETERRYCEARAGRYASYAARFAAKEAVGKALGTGLGGQLGFAGIGVVTNALGAPSVELDAQGGALLRACGGAHIHLSLTHTGTHAQAIAIISA
ncbi:MAG: holo-ACP synthase [Puniceicoccales bacterium]|jgi:holo-[acyl-carrier protein] synthase|nr:holo-ACP synthase [Puniceicoccales bacterium]